MRAGDTAAGRAGACRGKRGVTASGLAEGIGRGCDRFLWLRAHATRPAPADRNGAERGEDGSGAIARGQRFEAAIVARLAAQPALHLLDLTSASEADVVAVLLELRGDAVLTQTPFDLDSRVGWVRALSDKAAVPVGRAIPDFIIVVRTRDALELIVVDAKSSSKIKASHIAQITFYAHAITAFLQTHSINEARRRFGQLPLRLSTTGAVWLPPDTFAAQSAHALGLELKEHAIPPVLHHALAPGPTFVELDVAQKQMAVMLSEQLPGLLAGTSTPAGWHIGAHCTQCEYLTRCRDDAKGEPDTLFGVAAPVLRWIKAAIDGGEGNGVAANFPLTDIEDLVASELRPTVPRSVAARLGLTPRPKPIDGLCSISIPRKEDFRLVLSLQADVTNAAPRLGTWVAGLFSNHRPTPPIEFGLTGSADHTAQTLIETLYGLCMAAGLGSQSPPTLVLLIFSPAEWDLLTDTLVRVARRLPALRDVATRLALTFGNPARLVTLGKTAAPPPTETKTRRSAAAGAAKRLSVNEIRQQYEELSETVRTAFLSQFAGHDGFWYKSNPTKPTRAGMERALSFSLGCRPQDSLSDPSPGTTVVSVAAAAPSQDGPARPDSSRDSPPPSTAPPRSPPPLLLPLPSSVSLLNSLNAKELATQYARLSEPTKRAFHEQYQAIPDLWKQNSRSIPTKKGCIEALRFASQTQHNSQVATTRPGPAHPQSATAHRTASNVQGRNEMRSTVSSQQQQAQPDTGSARTSSHSGKPVAGEPRQIPDVAAPTSSSGMDRLAASELAQEFDKLPESFKESFRAQHLNNREFWWKRCPSKPTRRGALHALTEYFRCRKQTGCNLSGSGVEPALQSAPEEVASPCITQGASPPSSGPIQSDPNLSSSRTTHSGADDVNPLRQAATESNGAPQPLQAVCQRPDGTFWEKKVASRVCVLQKMLNAHFRFSEPLWSHSDTVAAFNLALANEAPDQGVDDEAIRQAARDGSGPLRSALRARAREVNELFQRARGAMQHQLLFDAPPLVLAQGLPISVPELNALAFIEVHDVFERCRKLQESRCLRPVKDQLEDGSALQIECCEDQGGETFVLGPASAHQLVCADAAPGLKEWILVSDDARGIEFARGFQDLHFMNWPGHYLLASIDNMIKREDGSRALLVGVAKNRQGKPKAGMRYLMFRRYVNMRLLSRSIRELERLEGCSGTFLDLVRGCGPIWEPRKPALDNTLTAEPDSKSDSLCSLAPSQERAVAHILAHNLTCIWGPAGSGKTFTIAAAVQRLVASQRRCAILVTAQSKSAIRTCLKAVQATLSESMSFVRIGIYDDPDDAGSLEVIGKEGLCRWLDSNSVCVVGSTVWKLHRVGAFGNNGPPEDGPFDVIVVDEAAQLRVAHAAMAIRFLRHDGRLIVAGDHFQLSPISVCDFGRIFGVGERHLATSFFECLLTVAARLSGSHTSPQRLNVTSVLLRLCVLQENHRMNACLGRIAQVIYGPSFRCTPAAMERTLSVASDPSTAPRTVFHRLLKPSPALSMYNVHSDGTSRGTVEQHEALAVADLVRAFANAWRGSGSWSQNIIVLVAHHTQRRAILAQPFVAEQPGLFVDTIEKAQGRTCEVVVLCYASAQLEPHQAGFLFTPARLRVGLTRARTKCIVLTSPASLAMHRELGSRCFGDIEVLRGLHLFARVVKLSECSAATAPAVTKTERSEDGRQPSFTSL